MENWASIARIWGFGLLLVCYMPLALRGGIFWAYSSHTRSRAATRVKIINRCGVASLRRSNRCGSPPIANRLLAAG